MRRVIAEEHQIISTGLHEYPDQERKFNEYELGYLSKPPRSYYPILVCKFFASYLIILVRGFPKGSNMVDMQNRTRVPVRGVIVDIFYNTIN